MTGKTWGGSFPSPIGELHFSITFNALLEIDRTCFRPLSGSYISQWRYNNDKNKDNVSVPYRGATFLNRSELTSVLNDLFPSPIGELHFSIVFHSFSKAEGSRFPSPIGELHFSIEKSWLRKKKLSECFRPLSGSYISQLLFIT